MPDTTPKKTNRLGRWKLNQAPYLDKMTVALTFCLFFIAMLPILTSAITGSMALAIITAGTVGLAVHEIRRPDENQNPVVRPEFRMREGDGDLDVGVRNFGPGPALYFQLEVAVGEKEQSDKESYHPEDEIQIDTHLPRAHPVHLAEGEFWNLREDGLIPSKEAILKEIEDADMAFDEPMLLFRYSWVSRSGARTPSQLETDRDDESVLDRWDELVKDAPRRLPVDPDQE